MSFREIFSEKVVNVNLLLNLEKKYFCYEKSRLERTNLMVRFIFRSDNLIEIYISLLI